MRKTISVKGGLNGTVQIPPDKSIAHRAAMFAALADGTSTIGNYAQAADPQTTLKVIQDLGVKVEQDGTTVLVHGRGRHMLQRPDGVIDCENSGTTMRLMAGILSGAGIKCTLKGDASLSKRPMKRVMGPLGLMGAKIEAREGTYPPLELHANKGLKAIDFALPIASAQLKSCVLLAGLFCDDEVIVRETVRSRNHTEVLLELRDEILADGSRLIYSSKGHQIPLQNYDVPGDFSSATFWMVAGSIMREGELILRNVGLNPTRDAALHVLRRMGADIRIIEQRQAGAEVVADLSVSPSYLQATSMSEAEVAVAIDEIPVLSVAMAFAEGESEVRGAGELRVKECDRIDAMAGMLRAMGVPVEEYEDGYRIEGQPDHRFGSLEVDSRHDHRIAMSAGVAAVRCDGEVSIEGAEHAAVSYPGFWTDLERLTTEL
jgi:3-phosphoshikimate 1-carboxyvinyltransferase